MSQLTKKGNGGLFSSLRNNFGTEKLCSPRVFDFDNDFFNGGIAFPPVNINETDNAFNLDLSVPGMKRDDFKIDIEDNILTISSEKEEEKKEDDKNYRRREFSYSGFSRSFTLPDNIDESNINAKYNNGMLQLTIPKKEGSPLKPKKQITVA